MLSAVDADGYKSGYSDNGALNARCRSGIVIIWIAEPDTERVALCQSFRLCAGDPGATRRNSLN